MNLSGIHPYRGMYDYNITKDSGGTKIAAQQAESKAPAQQERTGRETDAVQTHKPAYCRAERPEDSYDYAQRYEPGRTYEMKGRESALESLDMERAISEMQRDQLLHQYQFFVGSSAQAEQPREQEWRIPRENFNI